MEFRHDHQEHTHATDRGRHNHGPGNYNRAFLLGIVLNIAFVGIEAGYGYFSHSLALFADAGHNLSDVLGLVVAWIASVLVRRKPTAKYTYGLRSSSILAALFNAVFLLVAVGIIVWEAIGRLREPNAVEGSIVIIVAGVGIAINAATALLFMSGRKSDLNVRGAFLHMAADAGVSLGVVLAGILIVLTGWLWLDPIISLLIAGVIIASTWSLLRDSVDLALNAVPAGIDPDAIRSFLLGLQGVSEVHDLHVWGMSTTENALTAHIVMPKGHPGDAFLAQVGKSLKGQFGIPHSTLQIEVSDSDYVCELEPGDVV